MSHLPPELIEHILGYLKLPQDRLTLRCSSLVCSNWLPVARQRLFARLRLREGLVHGGPSRDMAAFLEILSVSPGIGLSVKGLDVRSESERYTLSYRNLVLVLQGLPHLRYLVLKDMYLPGSFPDNLGGIPCSSLKKLSLVSITNPSQSKYGAASIFDFLLLFSRIRKVRIVEVHLFKDDISSSYEDIIFPSPSLVNSKISSLLLASRDLDNETFLRVFQDASTANTLIELDITHDFTRPIFPIVSFLSKQCHNLQKLALQICLNEVHIEESFLLAVENALRQDLSPVLQQLHALRSFCLFVYAPSFVRIAQFWNFCPALFSMLPSNVSKIHIYTNSLYFPFEDTTRLDRAVAGHKNLENIYVHMLYHGDFPLKETPRLSSKKITLHVDEWKLRHRLLLPEESESEDDEPHS